jgi:hypothetical protein
MQGVKDTLNLFVSIVAAGASAYLITVATAYLVPSLHDEHVEYVYLGALLVMAMLWGGHLMTHLKWRHRFAIIVAVPVALGIVYGAVQLAQLDSKIPWADRVRVVGETSFRLLFLCAGLGIGAALVRARQKRNAENAA